MVIRTIGPIFLLLICVFVAGTAMIINNWWLLLAAVLVGFLSLLKAYATGWGRMIPEARLRGDRTYKIEHQTWVGGYAVVFIRNAFDEILVVRSTHTRGFTRFAIHEGNLVPICCKKV